MAESQLLAGTGVAILAVSAYLQSCNAARRRWIHLIVYTPETSVEAAWQRLEQMQKGSEGGQLLRPVIFAKLKGESWVPPTDAVPDRFGKPAAYVETKTFEDRWKCVSSATTMRDRAREATDAGSAQATYRWERETELIDTSCRGSTLYLRDPNYNSLGDDLIERWMQGRVDACSGIQRLCVGQPDVVSLCDAWRNDLDALRRHGRSNRSGGGQGTKWAEAGSVRVDSTVFNYLDLLIHNSRTMTPLQHHTSNSFHTRLWFPPPPVTFAVREEENVVPIGRPLFLLAHLTLEPCMRGRRLVATRVAYDKSMCVYGTEDETVAQLRRQVQKLDAVNAILAAIGLASLVSAFRPARR